MFKGRRFDDENGQVVTILSHGPDADAPSLAMDLAAVSGSNASASRTNSSRLMMYLSLSGVRRINGHSRLAIWETGSLRARRANRSAGTLSMPQILPERHGNSVLQLCSTGLADNGEFFRFVIDGCGNNNERVARMTTCRND